MSCKSHYKEYLKKRQDAYLLKNLTEIKSQVDTSRPKSLTYKSRKPLDKIHQDPVRTTQIHEENKYLLQRMLRIDLKAQVPEKKIVESVSTKSLNKPFRQKQLELIHDSNRQMMKRIQSTGSVYSKAKWAESDKFHKYIRDNISRNSGRVWRKKLSHLEKPAANIEDFSSSLQDSFENLLIK